MSKVKENIAKIKSKIESIKKLNDDPRNLNTDSVFNKYLSDLPTTDQLFGKKLDAYQQKRQRKKENKKDIFSELLDLAESFLDVKKERNSLKQTDALLLFTPTLSKRRLRRLVTEAADKTNRNSRKIITDNVTKHFFAADGICGSNAILTTSTISISPKEFDILNVFSVSPSSNAGKIIYEPAKKTSNKEKTNLELYKTFSGGTYSFQSLNNKILFDATWDSSQQEFTVSGLTQGYTGVSVSDFFLDYYSSIELPDISGVTKTVVQQMFSADNGETYELTQAQNTLNRLCNKLFASCGSPESENNTNPTEQFNENDEDLEYYFDFDDVEGIDIEEEDARLRKVLRFRDCNNFEIPINSDLLEDFVYLFDKNNSEDTLDGLFARAATDAYEKSDGTIPPINFQLPLIWQYLKTLPKALVSSILTPKVILPIIIIYKAFKSLLTTRIDVKELFKRLKVMFTAIIKDILWKFLKEFWKLIKRDLLQFLSMIAMAIVKSKYKRYVVIVTSLIALLRNLLESGIDNCQTLFSIISKTIDTALSVGNNLNLPGFLLGLSNKLPGYSKERALMNVIERLNAAGIPTDSINGSSNDLVSVLKGMIDGQTEEMDQNSFVEASNSEVKVPTPVGPIIIPPGVIKIGGKFR